MFAYLARRYQVAPPPGKFEFGKVRARRVESGALGLCVVPRGDIEQQRQGFGRVEGLRASFAAVGLEGRQALPCRGWAQSGRRRQLGDGQQQGRAAHQQDRLSSRFNSQA